jgi:hypothetical protein
MRLPLPVEDKVRDGLQLTWESVFQSHLNVVMLPLLATTFCAPVRRKFFANEPRFLTFLVGSTGKAKTTRAMLCQSYFGDFDVTKIFTWRDTPLAIEQEVSLFGDATVVVDELSQERIGDTRFRAACSYLQGISQGTSTARLSRSGRLVVGVPSVCTLLVTAQILPFHDQAMLARWMIVRVANEFDITDPRWTTRWDESHSRKDLLPYAMSGWISWCMQQPDLLGKVVELRARHEASVRDVADAEMPGWQALTNVNRSVRRLAILGATTEMLLDFSVVAGAIDQTRRQGLLEEWNLQAMPWLLGINKESIEQSGVAETVISRLIAHLQAGSAYMLIASGGDWPDHKMSNAVLIGVIDNQVLTRIKDTAWDDSFVTWRGATCRVSLYSSCEVLLRDISWRAMRSYLCDEGMAYWEALTTPDKKRRLTVLKAATASRLLESISSPSSSTNASESSSEHWASS